MKYNITNYLSLKEIKLLKSLIGTKLNKIFCDDVQLPNFSGIAITVVIDIFNTKIKIKNESVYEVDRDEYPKFKILNTFEEMPVVVEQTVKKIVNGIETYEKEKFLYKDLLYRKLIKEINVVRDIVKWNRDNNNWIVKADIGIRIILEDRSILLLAIDSLAGFIYVIDSQMDVLDEKNELSEYWGMKSENIDFLKREEISLSMLEIEELKKLSEH